MKQLKYNLAKARFVMRSGPAYAFRLTPTFHISTHLYGKESNPKLFLRIAGDGIEARINLRFLKTDAYDWYGWTDEWLLFHIFTHHQMQLARLGIGYYTDDAKIDLPPDFLGAE